MSGSTALAPIAGLGCRLRGPWVRELERSDEPRPDEGASGADVGAAAAVETRDRDAAIEKAMVNVRHTEAEASKSRKVVQTLQADVDRQQKLFDEVSDATGFWLLVAAGCVSQVDALLIRADREPSLPGPEPNAESASS